MPENIPDRESSTLDSATAKRKGDGEEWQKQNIVLSNGVKLDLDS